MFRSICLIVLVLAIAGCGSVDWFPEYVRLPTTPDQFSFTSKTGVATDTAVTSDPITVSGLTGDSSPVSVKGPTGSNSKYSINGGTATDVAGTVKNTDKVTVTHTSASALGTSVTSTLTIGNVLGTFTSTTQTVATPSFPTPTVSGGFIQAVATVRSIDGIPAHVISIKDGNAQYSLGDEINAPFGFTSDQRTIPLLNNRFLFLRAPSSTLPVTTTLTIDATSFTVIMNINAFTVTLTPPT